MNLKRLTERNRLSRKVSDTSRRQKAEQMLRGGNPKGVKTFCIMTAENPMGKKYESGINKERNNELEYQLKLGNYKWFPIKGSYGSREHSYIIYNISLDDSIYLGDMYNQESIIFATINGNEVVCEYMEKQGNTYVTTNTETKFVDATNDEDFWSQISRNFKFRIPFFDHAKNINLKLSKVADAERLLKESVSDSWTGTHHYKVRCKLWR